MGGKTPRVKKSLLQKCIFDGSLALLNFHLYYWSAHIHKWTYWLKSPQLLWCRFETQSCVSSSPVALLTSSLPSSFTKNPLILSPLKTWILFRRHFKFLSTSTLMPLMDTHLFPPSFTNTSYKLWHSRGIKVFRDLFKDSTFAIFSHLSSDFNLPTSHLLYFQIRHCASSLLSC